jgi:hypothetical protein
VTNEQLERIAELRKIRNRYRIGVVDRQTVHDPLTLNLYTPRVGVHNGKPAVGLPSIPTEKVEFHGVSCFSQLKKYVGEAGIYVLKHLAMYMVDGREGEPKPPAWPGQKYETGNPIQDAALLAVLSELENLELLQTLEYHKSYQSQKPKPEMAGREERRQQKEERERERKIWGRRDTSQGMSTKRISRRK